MKVIKKIRKILLLVLSAISLRVGMFFMKNNAVIEIDGERIDDVVEKVALLISPCVSDSDSDIDSILTHLNSSIHKVTRELYMLKDKDDSFISLYGPYLGRSLMELSVTAILARVDPLRVLIVRGNQTQPKFDISKPHKSSIRWQGDVMTDAVDLWNDKSLSNPTRALFGGYQIELVFVKSVESLFDQATEDVIGDRYSELTSLEPKALIEKIKSRYISLYSTLSKGIHHEFVIPIESTLDRDTVLTELSDVIYYSSTLGLLTSFITHAYGNINEIDAMNAYKTIDSLEVM